MMSKQKFRIEKNVPLPERSDLPPLPLEKMEVGHSFVMKVDDRKAKATIRQRLNRYQVANKPTRFSMMKLDDEKVRIFRVEDYK